MQVDTVSYSSKANLRDTNRGNYDKLRGILGEIPWTSLESPVVETHWDRIATKINQATAQSIPLRKQRPKNMYVDVKIRRMRKRKNKFHSNYMKSGSEQDWEKYAKARNKLRKSTRNARRDLEGNLVKNMKASPKILWKYINLRLKAKAQVGDLRRGDGSFAQTSEDKAEELNMFFSSIFTEENLNDIPNLEDRSNGYYIDDVEFAAEDIKRRMEKLSPNKSPGPDCILARVLQEAARTTLSTTPGTLPGFSSKWCAAKPLEDWTHLGNIQKGRPAPRGKLQTCLPHFYCLQVNGVHCS